MSIALSTTLNLDSVNTELSDAVPADRVDWAKQQFEHGLVMTSSFGAQSAVMLHLVTRQLPDIPVILVDTGYLFPETYRFAMEMTERLGLNLKVYRPTMTAGWMEAIHGKLWTTPEGLKEYHRIVKVEPMQRALDELNVTAWLAGLRAQQSDHRGNLRIVERQDGYFKVHPIIDWTTKDVHDYLKANDLPYHPLYERGYKSIGDIHSTLPITAGMSEREGRFGGMAEECGLHLPQSPDEEQSRESSGL